MGTEVILKATMVAAVLFGALTVGYFSTVGSDGGLQTERENTSGIITVEDENPNRTDSGREGLGYMRNNDSVRIQKPGNVDDLAEAMKDSWKEVDGPLFRDVSRQSGFNYSAYGVRYREEDLVQGVYLSDVNNDLRTDILAVGGERPILFKNTGGGFVRQRTFGKDVDTAIFFDYNNDGWDDLYLLSDNGSVFFENKGGKFTETEVGLEVEYESVRGASAADYTGNGCVDVFVVQANDWKTHRPEGYDEFVSIKEDNGNENRLFRGNCGSFVETTTKAGIRGKAWSLATSFVDLTNGGYPDIHVANDFNNDVVYINNGNGTFERNVLPNSTNRNGMSSEIADVNSDGYLDVFVSNIYGINSTRFAGRTEGNSLLINQGNGTFVDEAEEYGVQMSGWGWAAGVQDYDNDKYLELYQSVSNLGTGGSAYWDGGKEGFSFVNFSSTGFEQTLSVGAALLDYNTDGDIDIAVANNAGFMNSTSVGRYELYKNVQGTGLSLQIVLREGNGDTILGSEVVVEANNTSQRRVIHSSTDYLSQDSRMAHFGLGDTDTVDRLRVDRPGGPEQVIRGVSTGQRLEISRSGIERRINLTRPDR